MIIFISFSEVRTIGKSESPLEIQLQYGPHNTILEMRLVQVRDSRVKISRRGRGLMNDSDSDDEETLRGRRNMIPKDEGMYKCMCIYINTYIHIYMHGCIQHIYLHNNIIHAYIEHAYIHAYIPMCIDGYIDPCIDPCMPAYLLTCINTI